jgi:uncharacterized protein with FMN-binding domain
MLMMLFSTKTSSVVVVAALGLCLTLSACTEEEMALAQQQYAAELATVTETSPPMPEPTLSEPVPAPEPAQATQSALPGLPFATATFTPGTFSATVPSYSDNPMTVEVSFSENQITDITVVEHGDSTYGTGWFWRSYPGVPDQILVRQSTQDIDAFTGATSTKGAVIAAVEDAITQAGASPAALTPQYISSPLPGDRFIPGFHEITVPANTMDIHGAPLVEGAQSMLYSDEDMTLLVSFGRNEFHLHGGGARGLGQGDSGHGESVYPNEISGGTWGGWWFRQVAHHQVNDRQSTQVDVVTGATGAASAIVWGMEQAIMAAGGDPAALSPRTQPATQVTRSSSSPDARFFVPGIYSVTSEGFGGDVNMTVTLDRNTIRRIVVDDHSETEAFWGRVWSDIRDTIYQEQTTNIDVDVFSGATHSTNAVLNGVRQAMIDAGETNPDNH